MTSDVLEKTFMKLGMTTYEVKAYSSLVLEGQLRAADIGKIANIPQSKIYSILELLEMRGLIQTLPSFPKEYKAIAPNIAAQKLLADKEAKAKNLRSEVIKTLNSIHMQKANRIQEGKIWTQFGRESFPQKGLELAKIAKKSFFVCTVHFSINPEIENGFKNALRKGVDCRIMGYVNKKTLGNVRKYLKIGVNVKHLKHSFLRFIVVDDRFVLFRMAQSENGSYTSIYVENASLAKIFLELFNQMWKDGENPETAIKRI